MSRTHTGDLFLQDGDRVVGKNRHAVLHAFAVSYDDLPGFNANVFQTQRAAFTVSEPTSVHHQKHQPIDASKVSKQLRYLSLRQHDWSVSTRPCPDRIDELKIATEYLFVEKQQRYYRHAIDCFGPERCMFESNFPVDRFSLSYHVLWNGFKKMVADFSEAEKHALFYGTAEKVYRLTD